MSDHMEFPCPHCGVNLKLDINCDHEKEISRLRDALAEIANDSEACHLSVLAKEALASPPKEEKPI